MKPPDRYFDWTQQISRRRFELCSSSGDGDSSVGSTTRRIVATDYCDESLAVLASNATASGQGDESRLLVRKWDAAPQLGEYVDELAAEGSLPRDGQQRHLRGGRR